MVLGGGEDYEWVILICWRCDSYVKSIVVANIAYFRREKALFVDDTSYLFVKMHEERHLVPLTERVVHRQAILSVDTYSRFIFAPEMSGTILL